LKDETQSQTTTHLGKCVTGIVLQYTSVVGDYVATMNDVNASILKSFDAFYRSLMIVNPKKFYIYGHHLDFKTCLETFGCAETIANFWRVIGPDAENISTKAMIVFLVREFCLRFGTIALVFVLHCCTERGENEVFYKTALEAIIVALEALNMVTARCEVLRNYCQCWTFGNNEVKKALFNLCLHNKKKRKLSLQYRKKLRKISEKK
jgi:hypothetical protein